MKTLSQVFDEYKDKQREIVAHTHVSEVHSGADWLVLEPFMAFAKAHLLRYRCHTTSRSCGPKWFFTHGLQR